MATSPDSTIPSAGNDRDWVAELYRRGDVKSDRIGRLRGTMKHAVECLKSGTADDVAWTLKVIERALAEDTATEG